MPHGSCFLWDPWLTSLHAVSDVMVAVAYFSIPFMLYLGRRHASVQIRPVLLLFAAFILSCGVGHLIRVWNIWHTAYWLEGGWSWVTGTISLYTAWQLKGLIPGLLGTQKALEEARQLMDQDHLTGIANRRGLQTTLEQLPACDNLAFAQHALVLIDLDGFKQVNDTYGHQMGDTLLRAVATVIHQQIRAEDLAARLGGDEFAILLVRCPLVDAFPIAERVRQAIAAIAICHLVSPSPHPGGLPLVSASMGITQLFAGETLDNCYHRADQALYDAKRQGKNRIAMAAPARSVQAAGR